MEVLQKNQKRAAIGCKPHPVPFRHSKLTEMFQTSFVGDGRAVMMIHVNPFDTGFDENSHVMRFSAVARDVQTTTVSAPKFIKRGDIFGAFDPPKAGGGGGGAALSPEKGARVEPEGAKGGIRDAQVVPKVAAPTVGDTPSARNSEVERLSVEELVSVEGAFFFCVSSSVALLTLPPF